MRFGLIVAPLLVGLGGAGSWWARQRAADQVVLPEFKDLPPGPRAPVVPAFGLMVGRSTLAEVEAYAKAHGLNCHDTSARALMKAMRQKKKEEKAAAEARGEEVDTVSKASSGKKSPMEQNPQVRLSCEGTQSERLPDRARAPGEGRVLFIFDSPTHPLRHVSYRRLHRSLADAFRDAEETYGWATGRLGAPPEATRSFPTPAEGDDLTALVPGYEPFNYRWAWADLAVSVTLTNFGKRGIDVYEAVEVPWPIRADAPVLPLDYVAPAPKVEGVAAADATGS